MAKKKAVKKSVKKAEPQNYERFWIVIKERSGKAGPYYKHLTAKAAKDEALRLAGIDKGRMFFACEVVGAEIEETIAV